MSNREKAIEALARHREGGADPSQADLKRAEKAVDELAIVLAHLVSMPSPEKPPDTITVQSGNKAVYYDRRRDGE